MSSLFACVHARAAVSTADLVAVAERFTPRFEVVGPLVLLDVSGLARLFGTADEIGAHLYGALMASARPRAGTPPHDTRSERSCAIAATQTAAALLALGQPGLTVVPAGDEARRLAALPVAVLGELERIERALGHAPQAVAPALGGPDTAHISDTVRGEDEAARGPAAAPGASRPPGVTVGGWHPPSRSALWRTGHPRATHQASQARRLRRSVSARERSTSGSAAIGPEQDALIVLGRWGIRTLGMLAALPAADVAERLGQHGARWQRQAVGQDDRPLVPWVADEPFEAALQLEWPIEGLEPLSFVLARLFEPLAARLERADRGAAILQTTLHLVTRATHVRTLQLPAPMRDAKTLRALVLLDLESHPPSAAVDRVRIVIEPTPARILQWELFERAQPSPEQVSTLIARLTALVGEGHVGSPRLAESWKPGAFEMAAFRTADPRAREAPAPPVHPLQTALRRFRLPVPARVTVREGRPVRVQSDRHGVPGGAVVQAAGPWRTSGDWWDVSRAPAPGSHHHGAVPGAWDRDEWDVELSGGLVYRIFVERDAGQWFIEAALD